MSITLVFTTARKEPKFDWFFASLNRCGGRELVTQIIICDFYAQACDEWSQEDATKRINGIYYDALHNLDSRPDLVVIPPKPNVWQGRHRLTPVNWWAKSSSLNTSLCHCKNDYIVFVDDRCVMANTFLDAVREAKENQYAVCGTYEKRVKMEVADGLIVNGGETIGYDSRASVAQGRKMICPGTWMFGCAFGLPTEWMLEVNGVDELWNSVSMEDTAFGQMLENNGYTIYHDPRMALVQDRTINEHGMKRSSKERRPHDKEDKTHKLIERLWTAKKSIHQWNLRELRQQILSGGSFPIPIEPMQDWFDGQKLSEMI